MPPRSPADGSPAAPPTAKDAKAVDPGDLGRERRRLLRDARKWLYVAPAVIGTFLLSSRAEAAASCTPKGCAPTPCNPAACPPYGGP